MFFLGKQQVRHGSVFYLTGVNKQELFNAAEKTKESSVDDIDDTKLKSLSLSPPDEGTENFKEVPVDVPEEKIHSYKKVSLCTVLVLEKNQFFF